jgi:hypothetical protein
MNECKESLYGKQGRKKCAILNIEYKNIEHKKSMPAERMSTGYGYNTM